MTAQEIRLEQQQELRRIGAVLFMQPATPLQLVEYRWHQAPTRTANEETVADCMDFEPFAYTERN